MKSLLQPWQLLLLILAGWINRRQQDAVEYLLGETAVQTAVIAFLDHYHKERNHQGLDNRLIEPGEEVGRTSGEVVCRERVGRMLRYYYRKAA